MQSRINPKLRTFKKGFSLVEMLVILVVILFISAATLINFPVFTQSIAMRRSTQRMALNFREVQNLAQAVRQVNLPGVGVTPPEGFGIFASVNDANYIQFADFGGDSRFQLTEDVPVKTIAFERGVSISGIIIDRGMQSEETTDAIHVVFSAPYARISIKENSGNDTYSSVDIVLKHRGGGLERSVVITQSGQVYLRP